MTGPGGASEGGGLPLGWVFVAILICISPMRCLYESDSCRLEIYVGIRFQLFLCRDVSVYKIYDSMTAIVNTKQSQPSYIVKRLRNQG